MSECVICKKKIDSGVLVKVHSFVGYQDCHDCVENVICFTCYPKLEELLGAE